MQPSAQHGCGVSGRSCLAVHPYRRSACPCPRRPTIECLRAWGVANIGSGFGLFVFMVGLGMSLQPIAWLGIALFAATVFFQLVNLPVEIDASNRAKAQLVSLGIVPLADMPAVNSVLNAAAWTYVAGTLQSVLTLLYYASYLTGNSDSDR